MEKRLIVELAVGDHLDPGRVAVLVGIVIVPDVDFEAEQGDSWSPIRRRGSVPLVVALLAPDGDDVETLVTTVAVVPRVLH